MRDDLNATAQSQFSDHDEYDSSADSFETPVASVERPQSVMRQPAILADHSIGTKYGLPEAAGTAAETGGATFFYSLPPGTISSGFCSWVGIALDTAVRLSFEKRAGCGL